MVNADVFVVGGGPAGLAAAIAARQCGLRVRVADRFRPPIDKACGEGLMPDAVAALRVLGVDFDSVTTATFRGIRFIGPDSSARAEFPAGGGMGIRRTLLHERLVERARQLGVEMHWGERVSGIGDNAALVDHEAVRYRWLIGADGLNSRVRSWAGLSARREWSHRIGLRQHLRIAPWSEFVEVYWGDAEQVYITPVGADEIGVALLTRKRATSFHAALEKFGSLASRLRGATHATAIKGAATVARRLRSICRGNVALIGDASGSLDAITGDGLATAFKQALALGDALAAGDLRRYEVAHRHIMARPQLIGRALLLMDANAWLRTRALRAFAARPGLLQQLLSVHISSDVSVSAGVSGAVHLGWELLKAEL